MSIWAIVPVKSLVYAKSRLAGRLDTARREELSRGLFLNTLRCLHNVADLVATLVVSADPAVLSLAQRPDVQGLAEVEPGGLNQALAQAASLARQEGADAIVVVPIDLPLVRPSDIASLVALVTVAQPQAVVAAPDRHGQGTNVLALRPPDAIPFEFGPQSLARHRAAALERGIPFHLIENPRLALDLDEPDDLPLAGLA